jgi:hypothetical protein
MTVKEFFAYFIEFYQILSSLVEKSLEPRRIFRIFWLNFWFYMTNFGV